MATAVRLIRSPALAAAVPYSYAAVVPGTSRLVFLAGACPLDLEGRTVAVGDFVGQAKVCVENMQFALVASDVGLTDVVFVRVLVVSTSRDDLAAVWEVVRGAFGSWEPPGTLQGVTVLGWQDQLVEVEVVAAVTDE